MRALAQLAGLRAHTVLAAQQVWRNKLIGNAFIYVGGTLLQRAFDFLLLPLLTRYLTPADYGIVGIGSAVSGFLALLIGLGIYSGVGRIFYDYRDQPEALRSYISTNTLFLLGVVACSVGLLLVFGQPIWVALTAGKVPFNPYVQLMVLGAGADALAQLPLTLYRTEQRAVAFVVAQINLFVLRAAAVIYLVVTLGLGASGMMAGNLIASSAVSFVLLLLLARRYGTWQLQRNFVTVTLTYCLPLLPHLLAAWALNTIDRLMLEPQVPLAELGLYNLGYQLGLVMNVLVFSFNQAYVPYYYGLMKTGHQPEKLIAQIIQLFVAGMGAICLFGVLFAAEFVRWVAPPYYAGAEVFVPPVLFGYLLLGFYNFAVAPLSYYKQTYILPQITLVAAAVNIGLNFWWIPRIGAMGAAWATACAYGVAFILAFFQGRRWQSIQLPYTSLALAVSIVLLAVFYETFGALWVTLSIKPLVKTTFLLVYAIFTFQRLVRPNLHGFRFAAQDISVQ